MSDWETIEAAAINFNGLVCALPRPARHHHIILALGTVDGLDVERPDVQGFVTSAGRFVDRVEARFVALVSAQVSSTVHPTELFSEDVW